MNWLTTNKKRRFNIIFSINQIINIRNKKIYGDTNDIILALTSDNQRIVTIKLITNITEDDLKLKPEFVLSSTHPTLTPYVDPRSNRNNNKGNESPWLQLQQQVVGGGAPVHPQRFHAHTGLGFHQLQNIGILQRHGIKRGASNLAAARATC